jgi:hypothetical protein
MAIAALCGKCSSRFSVPDQYAGKKGKCKKCGAVVTVPAASAAPTTDKPAMTRRKSAPAAKRAVAAAAATSSAIGPATASVSPESRPDLYDLAHHADDTKLTRPAARPEPAAAPVNGKAHGKPTKSSRRSISVLGEAIAAPSRPTGTPRSQVKIIAGVILAAAGLGLAAFGLYAKLNGNVYDWPTMAMGGGVALLCGGALLAKKGMGSDK